MPNNQIKDWQKAAIVGMLPKYGAKAIGKKVGVSEGTVKKYRDKANRKGRLEMSGPDMEVVQ